MCGHKFNFPELPFATQPVRLLPCRRSDTKRKQAALAHISRLAPKNSGSRPRFCRRMDAIAARRHASRRTGRLTPHTRCGWWAQLYSRAQSPEIDTRIGVAWVDCVRGCDANENPEIGPREGGLRQPAIVERTTAHNEEWDGDFGAEGPTAGAIFEGVRRITQHHGARRQQVQSRFSGLVICPRSPIAAVRRGATVASKVIAGWRYANKPTLNSPFLQKRFCRGLTNKR